MLSRAGMRVDVTADVADARNKLLESAFDLIIVGQQLGRRLSSTLCDLAPGTPVLLLAAALPRRVRHEPASRKSSCGASRRRHLMHRLAQSETSFRLLVESVEDYAIYMLGPEGHVATWNIGAERIKGWTAEEILGRHFSAFFTPEDIAAGQPQRELDTAAREGHFREQRLRRRKNGTVFYADITLTALTDAAGGLIGFSKVTRDVTAQREAAERLAAVTQYLTFITNNVPALVGYVDREGVYRFVNRRYHAELACGNDVVGKKPAEVSDALLSDSRIASALAGETLRFDARLPDHRELEVLCAPNTVAGVVDGFFALAIDVTSRRKAERLLFEERDRAGIILRAIGDAVVACDSQQRITYMNDVAERMTGWTQPEAEGRSFQEVVELLDLRSNAAIGSPAETAIREDRHVRLDGETALRRRDGVVFPVEESTSPIHSDAATIAGAVTVFHNVTDARELARRMSHLAQHDALTDLPNRVLLDDRLAQSLALVDRGVDGAILFLDLDRFKCINDSLGHQVGDQILQEVARRLTHAVRKTDTVSRQGGDEFVILLNQLSDASNAARVARNLIAAIEQPMAIGERCLQISASIGVALFPEDARDARMLLKNADTALYHAKEAGGGRVSFFQSSMGVAADKRLRMEQELRQAVQQGQLVLHYQPKISLGSGCVCGVEALVRWPSAGDSLISPADFIPFAEETGLISSLDEWVMRRACADAAWWQRKGLPPLTLSVNVSLAKLNAKRLVQTTRDALRGSGLDPALLELEFTESQILPPDHSTLELTSMLRQLGVRLAIDDFGTGYSSLRYLLSENAFDTIKIDRSFISGLPDCERHVAITRAVIQMGLALGQNIIAEGVEKQEQANCLARLGCQQAQGYLYSAPLALPRLVEFLSPTQHPWADATTGERSVMPDRLNVS